MDRESTRSSGETSGQGCCPRLWDIAGARRIAQPPEASPSPTDPPYRCISIYVSIVVARLGITANQVTAASAFVGLVGAACFAVGDYGSSILGALLLQAAYVLDFVDGEVARLQHRTSRRGKLLDLVAHTVIKTSMFLGIGYGLSLNTHDSSILLWGFSAAISISTLQALPTIAHSAGLSDRDPERPQRTGWRRLTSAPYYLFASPGLFGMALVGAAAHGLKYVLIGYGALTPALCIASICRYRFERAS